MNSFNEIKIESVPSYILTAVPAASQEPASKKTIWTASNNIESVDPDLPKCLDLQSSNPYDNHAFFLQLAVAAGNFYRRVLGAAHPKYVYGVLVHRENKKPNHPMRFSQFIDGLADFTGSNNSKNLQSNKQIETPNTQVLINNRLLKIGTNELSTVGGYKPIQNLMAIFALCYFFDDGDCKGDNVCMLALENFFDLIKLDPEAAFSSRFFNETQSDVNKSLENIYETTFFKAYSCALLTDYQYNENYEEIVAGLFKNSAAKKEFYDTLQTIIALSPAEIADMFTNAIDQNAYQKQTDILIESFQKRQTLFRNALHVIAEKEKSPTKEPTKPIKRSSLTFILNKTNPTETTSPDRKRVRSVTKRSNS